MWRSSLVRQLAPARRRLLSNVPESTVYGGPRPQESSAARRVTVTTLRGKHRRREPITVVTAYDYPSAVHVDSAGIDICLVGDSAAMVVHGHNTTLPITLDVMLEHCRAVARGAPRPLLVGDLPFGCYESSAAQAVDSAVRVLKEGGMDAIKLEGGAPSRISAAKATVEAGIAAWGMLASRHKLSVCSVDSGPKGRQSIVLLRLWRQLLPCRRPVASPSCWSVCLLRWQLLQPQRCRSQPLALGLDHSVVARSWYTMIC